MPDKKAGNELWYRLTGNKEKTSIFNDPAILGGYCFDKTFLDSSIKTILEESSGTEGVSTEKLSDILEISRAGVQEILKLMAKDGKGALVRRNFYSGSNWAEKIISSYDRNILDRLRIAGPDGLDPLILKIPGSQESLKRLTELNLAVQLDENLYWDPEVLSDICGQIGNRWEPGSRITVAMVRELTGLSRKYILPVFHFLESSGRAERDGNYRVLI